MNKRQNWLLITFVCAVVSITACGDNRTEDERVASAYASIESSRYRDAVIELRNVLRTNPDNVQARVGLGTALVRLGDGAAAEKELLRARDLGAQPADFADALSQALQLRGAHIEMLAEIDPDAVDDPALASILKTRRARSMVALGSLAEAEQIFDEQLAAGTSVEAQRIALLGKANIAAAQDDFATAEALLVRSLEIAPDSAESLLALSGMYMAQQKFAEARKLLEDARNDGMQFANNERFMVSAQLTEVLLGLQENEAAKATVAEMRQLAKDHPMTGYLSGRVEFQNGNVDGAIDYLQEMLSRFPNSGQAQTLLGAALIQREDLEQAEMFLASAVAGNPRNIAARRLLAETRLRMNLPDAALETIREGLRLDGTNADLLALLGRASVQGGDKDIGIEHLESVLQKDPNNLQANLALAAAYVAQGRGDKAVGILNALPAGAIEERRRRILTLAATLDRNDIDEIEKKTDALLKEFPDDPFVISVAGGFFASAGLLNKARAQYERALALEPASPSAMLNILRIDERERDFTRSTELYEAAYDKNKNDVSTMLILMRVYLMQGKTEQAVAMARRAYERDSTALVPNLLLADLAMRDRDNDAVERYAVAAVTNHPGSGQAHALMGMSHMGHNDVKAAIDSFERAVEILPNSYLFNYQLGHAQMTDGQSAKAAERFSKVLELKKDHLPSLRLLAILEARAGQSKRAEEYLRLIEQQLGEDNATVYEAIADVRVAQERPADAVAALAKAQGRSPNWVRAVKMYQLGLKAGVPSPEAPLERWIESAPEDAAPRLLLAQAYHQADDVDAAIEQYEAVVKLQPDAVMALNNVAWLYLEKAGPENMRRARELAQKAYTLTPDNADIADTFGWVLFRSDQTNESIDVLRRAMELTTPQDKPDIAYHLAAVLSATGAKTEARKLLTQALTVQSPFESRAEAKQLLDSL